MNKRVRTALFQVGHCVLSLPTGLSWQDVVAAAHTLLGCFPSRFDGTADGYGVNQIRIGDGPYRSSTAAALGLHQEGYEDEEPPGVLVFYCVESSGRGGETLISDSRLALCNIDGETLASLRGIDVRFRKQDGPWSSWRPFLDVGEDGICSFRFAEPEPGFRSVELSSGRPGLVEEIAAAFRQQALAHAWRPGDLLLIDNRRCLHGRNGIEEPARRSLLRLVFPVLGLNQGNR